MKLGRLVETRHGASGKLGKKDGGDGRKIKLEFILCRLEL
jgi:hypothetical protein